MVSSMHNRLNRTPDWNKHRPRESWVALFQTIGHPSYLQTQKIVGTGCGDTGVRNWWGWGSPKMVDLCWDVAAKRSAWGKGFRIRGQVGESTFQGRQFGRWIWVEDVYALKYPNSYLDKRELFRFDINGKVRIVLEPQNWRFPMETIATNRMDTINEYPYVPWWITSVRNEHDLTWS